MTLVPGGKRPRLLADHRCDLQQPVGIPDLAGVFVSGESPGFGSEAAGLFVHHETGLLQTVATLDRTPNDKAIAFRLEHQDRCVASVAEDDDM